MKRLLITTFLGANSVFRVAYAAEGDGSTPGSIDLSTLNPFTSTSLQDLLGKLVGNLIILAIPILSIMVIVGGFQLMTSAGNAEKATKGRKTLLYAVIGFAVIIISTSIAYILKNLLTS